MTQKDEVNEVNLKEIVIEKRSLGGSITQSMSTKVNNTNIHYNTKISFLLLMTTFSMGMLIYDVVTDNKCNSLQSVYIGILTGVMGVFIKTPEKK